MDLPKEKYAAPYPVAVAPVVNPASLTNSTKKGNCCALFFLSDDICDGMLDISFKRILKKSAATSPEWLELWSDELHGENGFIQYRSLLVRFLFPLVIDYLIVTHTISINLQSSNSLLHVFCVHYLFIFINDLTMIRR
jgi:hypothetical protein